MTNPCIRPLACPITLLSIGLVPATSTHAASSITPTAMSGGGDRRNVSKH